ncbi:hypothetical protein SAMN04487897_107102 [Paenibacillus sp. yr247]|uniref:hypothetical protein n=1 Tax=Paenibacillus sp. yr247 TaxID=1761880 RepID=UPI000883FE2E|nr:hypothetical protein [Paenibacillus sp. yr247]SDO02111.1 hypothetical protein SAMN04487897_107102 [Paenibacillus sp. yr247]
MFKKSAKIALHTAAISLFLGCLSLSGPGLTRAANNEEMPPPAQQPAAQQNQLIQTREIDVTGDRKPDTVSLVGMKMDNNSPYYDKLFIVVSGPAQTQVVIPLQGGYNPQMQFCDFISDKLPQIYVSAETGGSGGLSNYYIYSLKNNVPTAIPLPAPLHVKATFKKNYVVKMKIEETGKSFKVDIKDRKDDYEKFGVYKNGKVAKPIIVNVNDYGLLKPIDEDRDGICELMGAQRISGISNADTLGYATSVWKWQKGKWILKHSSIVKTLHPSHSH